MALGINYKILNGGLFGEDRILFGSFSSDTNPSSHKKGVRLHCWLTALFLRLFCNKIVEIKCVDNAGQTHTFYVNKGSLDKWISRHQGNVSVTAQEYADSIKSICNRYKVDIYKKFKVAGVILKGLVQLKIRAKNKLAEKNKVAHEKRSVEEKLARERKAAEEKLAQEKQAAQAKLIQEKLKAEAEKEAEEQEFQVFTAALPESERIHHFVMRELPLVRPECYIAKEDGTLTNELNNRVEWRQGYFNFWGVNRKNYPEYKRKLAKKWKQKAAESTDEVDKASKLERATKLLQRADELEKIRVTKMDKLKKQKPGFFPVTIEGRRITLTDFMRDATPTDIQHLPQIYYHGTTRRIANFIRQQGFGQFSSAQRYLETGTGAYFALNKGGAEKYAKHAEGIIRARLTPRKIAYINNYGALASLKDYFCSVAMEFTNQLAEKWSKEFNITTEEQINRMNIKITISLYNNLMRDFFTSSGYDAVYVPSSDYAGCPYLNVFDASKREVVEVLPASIQ